MAAFSSLPHAGERRNGKRNEPKWGKGKMTLLQHLLAPLVKKGGLDEKEAGSTQKNVLKSVVPKIGYFARWSVLLRCLLRLTFMAEGIIASGRNLSLVI